MPRRGLRALAENSGWSWIFFLFALSGIPILIDPGSYAPVLVSEALDTPLTMVWGASLLFGGACGIAGLMVMQPRIERIGLIWLGFATFLFWATITFTDFRATRLVSVLVYLSIFLAMAARFRQLGRVLRTIEYAQHREDDK